MLMEESLCSIKSQPNHVCSIILISFITYFLAYVLCILFLKGIKKKSRLYRETEQQPAFEPAASPMCWKGAKWRPAWVHPRAQGHVRCISGPFYHARSQAACWVPDNTPAPSQLNSQYRVISSRREAPHRSRNLMTKGWWQC